jgi:antitoxin ParD1/3/4
MAMIKKSITVTDKHADFIQSQIASGDFASDSEVIRDALRLKQEQMKEIEFLRETVRKARASGISQKNKSELLSSIKDKMRAEGAL